MGVRGVCSYFVVRVHILSMLHESYKREIGNRKSWLLVLLLALSFLVLIVFDLANRRLDLPIRLVGGNIAERTHVATRLS